MIYPILLIIALILLGIFLWTWLSREIRAAGAWLRDRILIARGGTTQQHLLEETQRACRERGLAPDCILVSGQVTEVYDHLRRRVIGQRADGTLPSAVALALGADVDAGSLFVRAVEAPADDIGRDTSAFIPFADISGIEQVEQDLPAGLAPKAESAIEIVTAQQRYRLSLEERWGVSARDLVERIRAMIEDGRKPDAAPLIVR